MKKNNLMPSVVLGVICLIAAFLLSFINTITGPIIEAAQNEAANAALLEVLPEGKNFEEITIDETYPSVINMGYRADGGFVFRASVTGKSSGLVIMCGIDSAGKIVATKVIAEQETDSYDAKVFPFVEGADGKYTGMDITSYEPYLVSGATLTSRAYSEAVKAALQSFVIASGGSVDIRTPEQILNDNCNEALGTSGVTFTKWFATEVLDGIDAVYESEDGRVFVVGDSFVGVKADGAMVNYGDVDTIVIAAANDKLSASKLTELAELPEGTHKSIKKISVTDSGNYVFEAEADGFSVHQYDDYSYGSNTPISIKISLSADGKIIDCLTVSHDETKGFGDVCATEEYYEGWRGVSEGDVKITASPITEDATDPGAISGATYTSEGYQRTVKRIFTAFATLTGGEAND